MAESLTTLKWGVERRLEFIEFRLFWEGGVNRSDIIEMFDVSVPQASKDLTLYQERAPNNALYDKSAKRYVASEHFEPHFLKPDPDGYLSRLRSVAEGLIDLSESWITQVPDTDIALTPRRDIDASVAAGDQETNGGGGASFLRESRAISFVGLQRVVHVRAVRRLSS